MGSITRKRGNTKNKKKVGWRKMSNASIPMIEREAHRGVLLPRCIVCEQVPSGGIRGGIRVKKAFICTPCEQQLMQSDVGSIKYHIILEKIKQILK